MLAANREHCGIYDVLDVAQASDRATAVDQEHAAAYHRSRYFAYDIRRPRAIDRRRTKNDDAQSVLLLRPAHLGLGSQLGLRVPIPKPLPNIGFVNRRATRVSVDVGGAQMNDTRDRRVDAGVEQSSRALNVDARDFLDGGPVRYERPAVEHVTTAVDSLFERRRRREIAYGQLYIECVKQRCVAAGTHEAADGVALRHQSLRQVPADEPGRARDQAKLTAR